MSATGSSSAAASAEEVATGAVAVHADGSHDTGTRGGDRVNEVAVPAGKADKKAAKESSLKRHDWMVIYEALLRFGDEYGHCNGA